jgi:two-component system, cell cycle sensor histidine kinase and response regulator CckA
LLSHEDLLNLFVAHLPCAVWQTDADGVFTYVHSHNFAAGVSKAEDYVGRSIDELFASVPTVLEANRRALAGEAHRATVYYGTSPWDGYYQPIRDRSGKIIGTAGVAIDISERLKTLADLQQTEEVTRRILETVPAGIVLVSPTGGILDANRQARDILGLAYDELTKRYVQDFQRETIWEDGSDCPPEAYPVSRCLATHEAQPPATIGVRRPDGKIVWCVFTAIPATHPATKEFIGAVVTFHDISQRKLKEQEHAQLQRQVAESQKLEAIGRLAGGLAHDLNNILSAILGHASLLRDRAPVGSEEHRGASMIEIAGERAARLTKQLLAFARHGSQRSDQVDIDETIAASVDLLSGTLRENLRITHRRSISPAIVVGDATQLQQVFLNLALNAQDAMQDSGDLVFETSVSPEGAVAVSVRDTGTGMTNEVRARIFEPFYTTKKNGTGMGLALAYGIITGHGGSIDVRSAPDAGTTFEIQLPRAKPELATPASATKTTPKRKYVLVVDDEEIVRSTTALLLDRIGWNALGASDGSEAVAIYREKSAEIAVVILDLVMPGMGGRECFRALRAFDPEVRAIVSSGYDRDGIAKDILGAGLAGFLQKPYTLAKLREALDRALA